MAEAKKAAAPPPPPPPPALVPAGESGDPAVQQLIARLDIARRNGDRGMAELLVEQLHDAGFSA